MNFSYSFEKNVRSILSKYDILTKLRLFCAFLKTLVHTGIMKYKLFDNPKVTKNMLSASKSFGSPSGKKIKKKL